ncbi:MAG TPA: hypothetical protein PLO75_08670, partial [Thermotogota bacterium]|nr:hypothetical protein [Thermotogota bacterium]
MSKRTEFQVLTTEMKIGTSSGSNCVPLHPSSSAMAAFSLIAFRYGLSCVIASYASAIEITLDNNG